MNGYVTAPKLVVQVDPNGVVNGAAFVPQVGHTAGVDGAEGIDVDAAKFFLCHTNTYNFEKLSEAGFFVYLVSFFFFCSSLVTTWPESVGFPNRICSLATRIQTDPSAPVLGHLSLDAFITSYLCH